MKPTGGYATPTLVLLAVRCMQYKVLEVVTTKGQDILNPPEAQLDNLHVPACIYQYNSVYM